MDSKTFFQNCPAQIIAIAGYAGTTTAAMLKTVFDTYFATTQLGDKVHVVASEPIPEHYIPRDLDILSDISNIDIVLYILSDDQLEHLAVNLQSLIIGQTTDPNTGTAVVRSTNLNAHKTFFLGRDLNSYALANRTLAKFKFAFPDDLPFPLPNLNVVGEWQRECAAAAALIANDFGFKPELIRQALAKFDELPHHLDFIREVKGVKYYDDGISISPELALVSIQTFNKPIVISTQEFPDEFAKRQIIIPVIKQVGGPGSTPSAVGDPLVDRAENLADATELASIFAVPGDTVLYTPAAPGLSSEEFVMVVNKL